MNITTRRFEHADALMDVELQPPEHRALLAAVLRALTSVEVDRRVNFAFGNTAEEIILKTEESGGDEAIILEDVEAERMLALSAALGTYATNADMVTRTFNPNEDSERPELKAYAENGPVARKIGFEMSECADAAMLPGPAQ